MSHPNEAAERAQRERSHAWLLANGVSMTGSGLIRLAFNALAALRPEERGQVTCWFCALCGRYVGPGDACHCENDE
jgi:hypothetical protein